ncbi:MAG: hypothetical protein PHS53_03450 [Candidatus Pacebacteria bacterium]|nr:hypothetical protein [Candidatus Paceibacterota bacterium]MDD5357172.1 hypothetical protein [Candidatus Paceibacterota bacterium]
MAKEIFQDVIPPGKRSIRRIPLKRQKPAPTPPPVREKAEKATERRIPDAPPRETRREEQPVPIKEKNYSYYEYPKKKRLPKILIGVVGGILGIALLVFLITTFASSATLKVTARQADASLDSDFVAQEVPEMKGIGYKTIAVSEDSKELVTASGTQDAKKKASGTVVLYNNFSTTPQKLIRNTRLETTDGLIFRIDSSVTIPGKATLAGKSIPGSVSVLAYADSPGEEYNVGLVDFTVPGFKGTTKYKDFYARSKTPMQGGLIGKINTITDKDRTDAIKRAQTKAVAELLSQVNTKKQDGFVLFSNSYAADFSNLPDKQTAGGSVEVGVHANLKAIVFDERALSNQIAEKSLKDFDGGPVAVLNMENLTYETKKADPKHPFDPGTLSFHLKGQPKMQWVIDTDKIVSEIAGKQRAELQNILATYHGIEKAEVVVKPFWLRSFPSDTSKITIEQH